MGVLGGQGGQDVRTALSCWEQTPTNNSKAMRASALEPQGHRCLSTMHGGLAALSQAHTPGEEAALPPLDFDMVTPEQHTQPHTPRALSTD